jgi:beta-lactamase superfamily II metal-dependent hydrolase
MAKLFNITIIILLLIFLLPITSIAKQVTATDRVTSFVKIRELPSGKDAISPVLGKLHPGNSLELIESVPRWHKIRMDNGQEGYVSKSWTKIVETTSDLNVSFQVHFLDVGTGDSTIINIGDKEIIIDGGKYLTILDQYVAETEIIQDPVELVIVTHPDDDHWKGFVRLFNFDNKASATFTLQEFWEPGFDRACRQLGSYDDFIEDMNDLVPQANFHRPLEVKHSPTVDSHQVQQFQIDSLPEVTFTLLHSESSPEGPNCAFKINNASIVTKIEIGGVKFLFMGDANGKNREDSPDIEPKYVEKKLLDLISQNPDILKADVLKVSHHGSETASAQKFINAVDPQYVIISASTMHHLPDDTVIERYVSANRVILRTDSNRAKNSDHIYCTSASQGQINCNYKDQFAE